MSFKLVHKTDIPESRFPGARGNPFYDELFHAAISAPGGMAIQHTFETHAKASSASDALRKRSAKSGIPLKLMLRGDTLYAHRTDR